MNSAGDDFRSDVHSEFEWIKEQLNAYAVRFEVSLEVVGRVANAIDEALGEMEGALNADEITRQRREELDARRDARERAIEHADYMRAVA